MLRWAARLFLLRILPRRLVPFITFIELAVLARGVLRGWQAQQRGGPGPRAQAGPRSQAGPALPPWRSFGRPSGEAEPPQSPRQVGPGAGATLRR